MKQRELTTEQKLIAVVKHRVRISGLELNVLLSREIDTDELELRVERLSSELMALKWILSYHEKILEELKCNGSLLPLSPYSQLKMEFDNNDIK